MFSSFEYVNPQNSLPLTLINFFHFLENVIIDFCQAVILPSVLIKVAF